MVLKRTEYDQQFGFGVDPAISPVHQSLLPHVVDLEDFARLLV